MGILVRGEPLSWDETKELSDYIKDHGVAQFIHLMKTMKQRKYEELKWGDEIEYLLFKFDHEKKRVYLHCKTQVRIIIFLLRFTGSARGTINCEKWKFQYFKITI